MKKYSVIVFFGLFLLLCVFNIQAQQTEQRQFLDVHHSVGPNTNYKLSAYLKLKANDPLWISGYALLGAFTTKENDIISGDYPTNSIDVESTLLTQLSDLEEEFNKVSFTFNSKDNNEALIGIFHCARATKNALFVDDFSLTEENNDENLLLNPGFEDDTAWIYVDSTRKFL